MRQLRYWDSGSLWHHTFGPDKRGWKQQHVATKQQHVALSNSQEKENSSMMTYDPSQTYGWGGMAAQHPLLAGAMQSGGIQHPLLAVAALQSQFGGGIQHPLLGAAALQSQFGGGIQHPLLAAAALQSQFGGGIQHPLLALGALQSHFGGGGIQNPLLSAGAQNPLAPQTYMGGQNPWGSGRGW